MTQFSLHSPKYFDGLGESPLEGYSCEGRTLYVSFGYKIKYWFYGLLSAIVLAILIAGFTVFDSYMDNKEFQFGWPPIVDKNVQQPADGDVSYEEPSDSISAITYLNEHDKWSKAVMDTLDALPTGLYDCLKQYRLADLANMTIDSCEQFNKIKEVAKKAMDNGVQMSKDYDDSPDSTITVMNWIKKVQNKIDHKSKTAGFSELADKPITTSLPKDNGTLANKVRETKQNRAQKGNSVQSKEKSVTDKKSLSKSDSKKSSIPNQSEW